MCTAVTFKTECFYFGRNLDLERSYNECVTVTPRNFFFQFRNGMALPQHYAMIGMATVCDGYPLYYEATNEVGLSMCGLNFPDNAFYHPWRDGYENIAPFELIPWILGQCSSVLEASSKLSAMNLWDKAFHEHFALTPLHWLLADSKHAIVIEPLKNGLSICDDPIGILTNNPPFDYHMHHLAQYMNLTPRPPVNRFASEIPVKPYSLGMGSIGLPGDPSSASRFVRAAFTKYNSVCDSSNDASLNQFFHILRSVAQYRGLTILGNNQFEITRYSSCCNTNTGVYYYTTYGNSQIHAIDMHREDLNGSTLSTFMLSNSENIHFQN